MSKQEISEENYKTILGPVVTEKTNNISAFGQVVFRVAKTATKPQIRAAVENIFDVTVKAVNTQIRKGKVKRFRGRKGKRADVKFATVTLKEGDTIDVSTGL